MGFREADPAERESHYHTSSHTNVKSSLIRIISLLCCCLEPAHSWVQPYPFPLPVHRSDALTSNVRGIPAIITCLGMLGWDSERDRNAGWNETSRGCPSNVRRITLQISTSHHPTKLLQRRSKSAVYYTYTGTCLEAALLSVNPTVYLA